MAILTLHSSDARVQGVAEYSKQQLTDGSEGQTTAISNVPVVPFDMDLYHWDNSEGKPPPIKKVW